MTKLLLLLKLVGYVLVLLVALAGLITALGFLVIAVLSLFDEWRGLVR